MSEPYGMNRVLEEIRQERERQAMKLGYGQAHDDEHDAGELSAAAACYAMDASCLEHPLNGTSMEIETARRLGWPWAESDWKPQDARGNLIRAAALIVAEIERIDRRRRRSRVATR